MLSGFQGSAADARVYHVARLSDFTIPPGKLYLADAGFAACDELLVPYRGVRYHLAEWDRAGLLYVGSQLTAPCTYMACRPRNRQELFNLRHATLRNVVERIFGVIKKCFHIIQLPPEYSSDIQSRIPPALCLVHNIIRIHDPDDLLDYRHMESDEWSAPYYSGTLSDGPPTEAARTRAHTLCDQIAQDMWEDYLAERARRGLPMPPGVEE